MTDIALAATGSGAFDLAMGGPDLAIDDGLETAVALSLFTDARAPAGAVLPYPESPRRGWWGDGLADTPGDSTGSLFWLLAREKQTPELLARIRDYARDALAWLIADGVALSVDVAAAWIVWAPGSDRVLVGGQPVRSGAVGLTVTITRPDGTAVTRRWDHVWQALED